MGRHDLFIFRCVAFGNLTPEFPATLRGGASGGRTARQRHEEIGLRIAGHAAIIDQAILLEFIAEGHFARHIRCMRELYASRMGVLRESVQKRLAGAVRLPDMEAGVHTPAWLSAPLNAYDICKAAAEKNVEALPLSAFASRVASNEALLLGYGAVDERELRRGVDVLAAVIDHRLQRKT